MSIRILLADDHTIVREGLYALLDKQPDMDVIEMVQNGREAVRASRALRPHLIIMDMAMPVLNGMEATRQICMEQPEMKVLCLSMHADKRFVAAALAAGAAGYMLKDCASEELIRAIHIVMGNHTYLSPAIASLVVEDYKACQNSMQFSAFSVLTSREREVLQLLAEGHTTKAIAARLHLSVKTIGTHREHLMDKLNIQSISGLTKYAIREGLTTAEA